MAGSERVHPVPPCMITSSTGHLIIEVSYLITIVVYINLHVGLTYSVCILMISVSGATHPVFKAV